MNRGQVITKGEMPLGKTEIEGIIGTEKNIDRKNMGQIEAQVGIEVEGMEHKELISMTTGSTHENTARRFLTWGNLR